MLPSSHYGSDEFNELDVSPIRVLDTIAAVLAAYKGRITSPL